MKAIFMRSLAATILFALLLPLGCSKSQPASEQPATAPKPATITVDASTAGTISGVVNLKGQPPKMKPLDMTSDTGCPTGLKQAVVVVANAGQVANAVVYVKEEVCQGNFAVPTEPVTLDQKGCRYNPHMLGIMAGQPLKIATPIRLTTISMTCPAITRLSMSHRCRPTSRSPRSFVIWR
jgi:hypothetical protein